MCVTTVVLGAMAIGTAISAYGQYKAGAAASDAGKANASIALYNAQVNQMKAEQAETKGELEKRDVKERLAIMRGQGRSRYAAGNVQLGSGSPEDWERDTEIAAAIDLDMIDYNTDLAKWGYGEEAKGNIAEAQMAERQGAAAYQSGIYGAAGSLISGGGNMADRWYTYKKIGAIS